MSDIEERLRGENWWLNVSGEEVADEIRTLHAHLRHRSDVNTDLRAEIERLRALLTRCGYAEKMANMEAEIERLKTALRLRDCALRQVVHSLETLGQDGWSEAPYLLRECRAALDAVLSQSKEGK